MTASRYHHVPSSLEVGSGETLHDLAFVANKRS